MITNIEKPDLMSPLRKAAVLMIVLGEQTCAEVLRELSEEEVQRVSQEVARVRKISGEQAEEVLQEFYQMTVARDYVLQGGPEYAKKMLMKAFGPEAAKKLLDLLNKSLDRSLADFDALQKADPQQLSKFIHAEHPQTIAMILSHLNSSQAAALLISLPSHLRSDVVLRMANLEQISPEVINKIAVIIGQKLKNLGDYSMESTGGIRAVAEMCNRLDSGSSKEVIDDIEKRDTNLAEMIRHLMFVFEDILMIDENGMKELLGRIDRKVLTVALKGTSDQLKQHFLSGMSQRGAEMLNEDMDSMGPVKIKNVEAAQQQIIALVRQLEAEGVISLRGTVGERYVV